MKTGELKAKSLAQLRDFASELDVVGRSRMDREELIDAILEAKAREARRQDRAALGRGAAVAKKPAAKPIAKPAARFAAKPAAKPIAKPAGRSAVTPAAKSAAKPVAKTATKPIAKPVTKTATKPAAKPAVAPVMKPLAKIAAKPAAKPEIKPAPKRPAPAVAKPVVKAAAGTVEKAPSKEAPKRASVRPGSAKPEAVPTERARKVAVSLDGTSAPPAAPRAKAKLAPAKAAPERVKKALPLRVRGLAAPKVARRGALKPAPAKAVPERTVGVPTQPAQPGPKLAPRQRRKVAKTFKLTPAAPPLNMRAGGIAFTADLPRGREPLPASAMPIPAPEPAPPRAYAEDRLVLLPRDPEWLYCYWELSQAAMGTVGEALARFGGQLALRVHDVTGLPGDSKESHDHRDVDLPVQSHGHWYCQSLGGDREHVVEIGLRQPEGQFLALARSNRVRTPRAPARGAHPATAAGLDGAAAAASEWMEPSTPDSPSHPSSPMGHPGGPEGPENAPSSPAGGFLPSSPASAHALQRPAAVAPPEPRPERDFWLVVDAELIVYGATEPDAHVKLQGQSIALRPDGTFSARFALPDGRQIIPVEATSADGVETREIVPTVQRQTRASRR